MIQASDAELLAKAKRVAKEFAQQYIGDDMVGIVFLGAIVRGYFDHASDIDIALFKKANSQLALPNQFFKVEGLDLHCHVADYESELAAPWAMAKRWTYAQSEIDYDPDGKLAQLIAEKVPLQVAERKWLLMSGLALSDWYINDLSQLWVTRGNLISAHHMFNEGLDYFLQLLFALNHELVADVKWRYALAERLRQLPANFQEQMQATMLLHVFSSAELERRRAAFRPMWRELLPLVEQAVQLSYAEIRELV